MDIETKVTLLTITVNLLGIASILTGIVLMKMRRK